MKLNENYNIGYICTKLQCESGHGSKTAFVWISAQGERFSLAFDDLECESNRHANILSNLGFKQGDIFFTFLPKCPEQFYSFLGTLKLKVICGTLFSNFGDEALLDRLGDSKAKGLITKRSFLKKISRIRKHLPYLKYILVTDLDFHQSDDILSYSSLMSESSSDFQTPQTSPNTPSVLHYTSGSTGKPKGVLHVHGSVDMQRATSRKVLKLESDDIYWCTADQGWVTGTSYGIIGPWSGGITQVHFGGMYDASRWCDILQSENVTIWYTAPTALRMLMREDSTFFTRYDFSRLKYIFSVGEPLNPEVIYWARDVLKKEIYDTWFQTETGAIMISNQPGLEVRPGSMGQAIEGIEPAILSNEGTPLAVGDPGNLCLKPGWPSMFVSYLNMDMEYRQKFIAGYYFTGDKALRDPDGYFWFKGRSDDVINTGGHLISPFEVESALLELEEVVESGVIGAPDALLYEKVVAFVHLRAAHSPSMELEIKLRLHVSNRVSTIATPQEMFFVENIPKNKSGKIMRRILKSRYLGLNEGDTSTLED